MTAEERNREGADEAIEDLDAPASAQGDVVGGKVVCADPTCARSGPGASNVETYCSKPTCTATRSACGDLSRTILVYEA
jgi:hypothetical protein